jgi:hypothetical protein
MKELIDECLHEVKKLEALTVLMVHFEEEPLPHGTYELIDDSITKLRSILEERSES